METPLKIPSSALKNAVQALTMMSGFLKRESEACSNRQLVSQALFSLSAAYNKSRLEIAAAMERSVAAETPDTLTVKDLKTGEVWHHDVSLPGSPLTGGEWPGYRRLCPGEMTQIGDEVWTGKQWEHANSGCPVVGDICRRKID